MAFSKWLFEARVPVTDTQPGVSPSTVRKIVRTWSTAGASVPTTPPGSTARGAKIFTTTVPGNLRSGRKPTPANRATATVTPNLASSTKRFTIDPDEFRAEFVLTARTTPWARIASFVNRRFIMTRRGTFPNAMPVNVSSIEVGERDDLKV